MSGPSISVVTPSYNQAEFIEETLRSVRRSDCDVEHVVVDGGSDDGTVEILREYEDEYELRWVSEPDRGQSHALNKGIEMATGDWIGFQMSDDYYLEGAFETVRDAIEGHPEADVVYGDVIHVDADGDEVSRTFNIPPSRFVQRYWSLYSNLQSAFFRAEVFDLVGDFDERLEYTMDADLFWRLLDADVRLVHLPAFLGTFRTHDTAKTPTRSTADEQAEWRLIYGDYNAGLERYVSPSTLRVPAKVLKALKLLRIGRFEAFTYNLRSIASRQP